MAASTDRDTRLQVVSAGPPRSVSFADESGRRARFGAVDRGCAAVLDRSPRGCVQAAGFAVVARPEGAALSARRRRGVPEDDSPVTSVRLGRGVGSARPGLLRREVAPVDVAAAGRRRGSRPVAVVAVAANLFADVRAVGLVLAVAVGLSPPVVLPLPTGPPRCDATDVRPPVLARAPIHQKYTHEVHRHALAAAIRRPV
ncbi:hypothetical protein ACFVKB_16825 [Rhodococcus sp. NPDC127530]|uniref:hypothetical protein n=1 Tax=unclassified Rhodococcus (in: high G+C Gram-positive bacteria) TaxID=192944 RepID=UPI00364367CF